jgi:hypothetical protein
MRIAAPAARVLLCLLVTVLALAYGTEAGMLIPPRSTEHGCGCAAGCVCRGSDGGCTCSSRSTVSLGAACGCGGETPTADAPSPPLAATLTRRSPGQRSEEVASLRACPEPVADLGVYLSPPSPP